MPRPAEQRLLTEANANADYVRRDTLPVMPHFTTAARPDPVAAGKGAHVFDDDLNKPIVSDGAAWFDFGGVAV